MNDPSRPDPAMIRTIAASARAEAGCEYDVERLTTLVAALFRSARTGRRLTRPERERHHRDGIAAAEQGLALDALVDTFLSAARMTWVVLADQPTLCGDRSLSAVGESTFRAVDDALAELAGGFAEARRRMVRREENDRHDLVDDLLTGTNDLAGLLGRAERFGLRLAASHTVVLIGPARAADLAAAASDLESAVRAQAPTRPAIVAVRHASLVLIVQSDPPHSSAALDALTPALKAAARRVSRSDSDWSVAVSRSRSGPTGMVNSYREAEEALDLLATLERRGEVVHAEDLAVFRVLLRDRESITELVESVLGPLTTARGGAAPLIETLRVFLDSGCVATETARRTHLSIRAVTYRLARVRELTGHDPNRAEHRLTLHVAAVGARLIGWPES